MLFLISVLILETLAFNNNASSYLIDMTQAGCHYTERFQLWLQDDIITARGQYLGNGNFSISGFPIFDYEPMNKVSAARVKQEFQTFSLQEMNLFFPTVNKILVTQDKQIKDPKINTYFANASIANVTELEVQLVFQQTPSDAGRTTDLEIAIVSIFVTNGAVLNSNHLPDGLPFLLPFMQIPISNTTAFVNVDLNLYASFQNIIDNFHQYIGFQAIDNTQNNTINYYFNQQKFYVTPQIMKNFFDDSGRVDRGQSSEEIYVNTTDSDKIVKICYGTTGETVMRQNYGVWFWLCTLTLWWLFYICGETDTDTVFKDDFLDNNLTLIPLYSVYAVGNDVFFSKLSRYTNILVYFSWQVLVITLLFANYKMDNTYTVYNAIILWYAIVAMAVSWPVTYFFGIITYNCRDVNKNKMRNEIDWKKITNKHSHEAEMLHRAIKDDEDRLYTYWFVYYGLSFLIFWANCMLCVYQMKYLNMEYSDYWVATIFVLIFLDYILLDSIVAFIGPLKQYIKYRGFYYEGELAQLWKLSEDN